MGIPVVASITLATADDDGICLSQSPLTAGSLTLNGVLVSGGVAAITSIGAARQVIVTSGGNDTGVTFTITGRGATGIPQSEVLTGASGAAATSALYYYTVSAVAISGASAGTVKVGTNGVGVTRWVNFNLHAQPANIVFSCDITGTVNYDLQYTYDDLPSNSAPKIWTDAGIVAATADAQATYSFPITWARILLNSGSGLVAMTAIQAGIVGG